MYLAPLNADRFFKKVFSDNRISKRFLEDFLEIEIESIELLSNQHKITDDAAVVEFDFRCKIDGKYVIIDMQQWYKKDVAQRFYLYHTANTVLQLEELNKQRRKLSPKEKKKKFMSYDTLMPAITLIWMVHDSLDYTEDYVGFRMLPEGIGEFVKDNAQWNQSKKCAELKKERDKLLPLLNNQTKNMDFLAKSRLVFMFQRNIVRNKKMKKYRAWFEFAEKTRQSQNTEKEFKEYEKDDVFSEIIQKLQAEKLQINEQDYIRLYNYYVETNEKTKEQSKEEGRKEERQKTYQTTLEKARLMKEKGLSLEDIHQFTDISMDVIKTL